MPKMKTHKGAKARVKITGRGKVKAMRTGKRHLNCKMRGKDVRQGRTDLVLAKPEADRLKRVLPYD